MTRTKAPVRVILMDVDDTLLDFPACARQAIQAACEVTGIPYSPKLFETFMVMNAGFWRLIEAGTLTLSELWKIRFSRIFEAMGISGDGPEFEALFHQTLDTTHETVAGAKEVLRELAERLPLYAASNGRQDQQQTRLALAGLSEFVSGVFTSESAGENKPSPVFFDYVMENLKQEIPDLVPSEVLMVGDSRRADVEGALQYGMQALWFHPDGDLQDLRELPERVRNQIPDRHQDQKENMGMHTSFTDTR